MTSTVISVIILMQYNEYAKIAIKDDCCDFLAIFIFWIITPYSRRNDLNICNINNVV